MKKLYLFSIFTILAYTPSSEYLMACHMEASGGDGGIWPTLRGHNPTSRQSGFLTSFEGTTAFSITSTTCDAYIIFLEFSYEQIAENTAQGHGQYLEALASLRGCSIDSKLLFRQVLHKNFSELFETHELNGEALSHRLEIVLNREPVLLDKCLLPAQSAYS
jgi:hypothetical protein